MENVCQKCGQATTEAVIAACQGTPDGGCVWKGGEVVASVPVENIKPELLAVPAAVEVLKSAMIADPDFAWAWHCNIAVCAMDAGVRHQIANEGAARFMQLLFDVDTRENPGFPRPELLSPENPWLDAHYKFMVDRFLAWKLPHDFCPDAGISFKPNPLWDVQGPHWPAGTNLLHAGQALEMFKHCVDLPNPIVHLCSEHSDQDIAKFKQYWRKTVEGNSAACQGTSCGATSGADHSPECIVEAAEAQGWADAPEAVEARAKIAAPKLTPADIEGVIMSEHYFLASQGMIGNHKEDVTEHQLDMLDHVTFCVLILRNGTKVTGVNHGPVSAANFDAQKGREYARKNAVEKIWELEGYLLRDRLANADAAEAMRNAPPPDLPLDSDAAKGAQLLAIVREFVKAQRISFPEVIHQTDRVIENAYELIQDLVDVAGYLPEEDEG